MENNTQNTLVTLKANHQFRRLYHQKAKIAPVLVTYVVKNRVGHHRIGITTGKKVGNAVKRNRARRLIREAYRLTLPKLSTQRGWDIVFVARTKTALCSMQQVQATMQQHLAFLTKDV